MTAVEAGERELRPARDDTSGTERFETVVIGGGQAGLAVGYHLPRRGRPFVILDAHRADRRRLAQALGLAAPLHPRPLLDGLPGWPFPAPASSFPTKDEVADYLAAYAARFDLPVRTGVRVDGLSRSGDRFVVDVRRPPVRGRQRRGRDGRVPRPRVPGLRVRARSGDRPAALQRVPEPVPAAGGRRPRRGRRQLGRRDRIRGVPRAPDLAVGEGHRARCPSAPGADRTGWSRR